MSNNSILRDSFKIKYKNEISFVRNNSPIISKHAIEQISIRKIKIKDVHKAIKEGVLIEVQDIDVKDGKDPKFLFQDATLKPPYFLTPVACKATTTVVVTAFKPDTDKWSIDGNNILRRKSYG